MDDLTAFVSARLGEDEAARLADEQDEGTRFADTDVQTGRFIWRFADEDRVKREVAAKRKRLTLMTEAHAEMDKLLADKHAGDVARAMAIGRARAATVGVKTDAEIWRDHPDYQQKWSTDGT